MRGKLLDFMLWLLATIAGACLVLYLVMLAAILRLGILKLLG